MACSCCAGTVADPPGASWSCAAGAIFTNTWMMQIGYTLGISYVLPLVLYFLLKFADSKKPAHLWIAASLEAYSMIGCVPYVIPIKLLVLMTFLVPLIIKDSGLLLAIFHWRTLIHPSFFCFVGFFSLFVLFVFGATEGMTIVDPYRDPTTGKLPLSVFLNQGVRRWRGL